jgi:hypothetical protein
VSKELAKAITKSGIVPTSVVEEIGRWGMSLDRPSAGTIPIQSVPEAIEKAMGAEDYVRIKETDLDIVGTYMSSKKTGRLHFEFEGGESDEFDIEYGVTRMGEIVIPWKDEDISDVLINGFTYLVIDDKQVKFKDARELYYDDDKTFVVCTPE